MPRSSEAAGAESPGTEMPGAGTAGAGVVTQIEPTDEARALVRLGRVDYADSFRVDARRVGPRSGEEWARATLERVSPSGGRTLRLGWKALGLKVAPRGDANAILGWPILHSGDDFALLGFESLVGMPGRLLFKPEGETVLFGTFIEQRNPLMKAVWAPIQRPHWRIVSRLLAGAERRLAG